MMYKSKSSVSSRLRALSLVPAGALALLAVQIPAVASAIDTASETTLVSDSKDTKNETPSQVATVPLEEALEEIKVVGYGYQPHNADGEEPGVIRLVGELDGGSKDGAVNKEAVDYYVDGKKVTREAFNEVAPYDISAIEVNKNVKPAQIRMTTNAAAEKAAAVKEAKKASAAAGDNDVFTQVEEMPQYPGGMKALLQYLAMNIRYPKEGMEGNIEGRVVIKFVVSKTGKVENPEVIRSVSPELDAEAIRVVNSLPAWTPGKVNGKPVACYYTLPIAFKLTSTGTEESTESAEKAN